MAAEPNRLHPAVQYLKDNAVVIGLVVIVVASLAVFAVSQSNPGPKPVAQVQPTSVPTAALDNSVPIAGSPSAAPGSSPGATGSSTATATPQNTPQPSATATTPRGVTGVGPQSVRAKDWRQYATDFSEAWTNTDGGKDAWLARLKPLVSADLYAGFTKTDLRVIPAGSFESVSLGEESLAAKTFHAYSKSNVTLFEARLSVQADGSWQIDQIGAPNK